MKAGIWMKVVCFWSKGESNITPKCKTTSDRQCSQCCTSRVALVVYGLLGTCQQLLQLTNEC